jgi:ssDNA-binding replication factor A large subunit
MKVNELKNKNPVDEITLKITAKEEPRDLRDGTLRVCSLTGEDESGQVTVTLWNEDIDKVNEGDTIKITKGWASKFNNNMQVSAGRLGKLEVL